MFKIALHYAVFDRLRPQAAEVFEMYPSLITRSINTFQWLIFKDCSTLWRSEPCGTPAPDYVAGQGSAMFAIRKSLVELHSTGRVRAPAPTRFR